MSTTQKLTKKQKKGIAFRERKSGKGKEKDDSLAQGMETNDIPVMEIQDIADEQDTAPQIHLVDEKKKTKKKPAETKGGQVEQETKVGPPKKRKREADVDAAVTEDAAHAETPKRKKNRGDRANDIGPQTVVEDVKVAQNEAKQRFILFVGNLKYTTSLEAIKAHFAACDPPPTVRLLTPKATPKKPINNKSKGCAFLEFSHRNALQQALKLHQSDLEGRMINVELTAGGGGKSDTRITKLKERNKGLFDQRKQRTEKQGQDGTTSISLPERPQRYSVTSGIEQVPVKRRTWTVGDIAEDGVTHRGGKRHTKGSKTGPRRAKEWGTGVNAIPVG